MPLLGNRDWSLTPQAFESLLSRLAADREVAAEEYEKIRRKLFSFFDWRGSPSPETHADETIDRLARKLAEGQRVEHVSRYAYGVARRVLLEWERRRAREASALDEMLSHASTNRSKSDRAERRLASLERCLQELPDRERALILEYYQAPEGSDVEARKRLAQRLGMPYGTLKTRAHRVRGRLQACLQARHGPRASDAGAPGAQLRSEPPFEGSDTRLGGESEWEARITAYLLGTLPPDAQQHLEERYFVDDGFYEEMLATGDDLIRIGPSQ